MARTVARIVGTLAALFLGGVLLVAAYGKALDPVAFAEQIRAEGLEVVLPASTLALLVLGIEGALGALLVLGVRRLWVLAPAAALVALFLALTGRTYWLAAHGQLAEVAACGCFGNLVTRTPAEAFWQDLLLLAPALALAFVGRRSGRAGGFPRRRLLVAAAIGVLVAGFAWMAPALPLDDLATRLRPGVSVGSLCAGGEEGLCLDALAPELEAGRTWVILATLDDPTFQAAVGGLNAALLGGADTGILALTDAAPEAQRAFFWQWGPAFPIREAPPSLLRPLYRTLPRSFLVVDGVVERTVTGLPPLTDGINSTP